MATILEKNEASVATARQPTKHSHLHGGSLQAKLLFAYTAVIVAVLILLNTYPLIQTQNMMFRSKQTALQGQALLIAGTLPVAERLTSVAVEQSLGLVEDLQYTRIMVTNEAGLVLYDTEPASIKGQYALTNGVVSALRGKDVFYGEYADGVFRSFSAVPVMARGRIIGAVYLYDSDAGQGILLREVQSNLRMISLLVCGLVIVISVLLSRLFSARFSALLAAVWRVREGEYTHRITIKGRDEFAQLGEEFNELTGRLQVTEEARRRFVADASHELKTPLASIKLLSDSILQGDMPTEMTREFVGDIGDAADRLINISEDLLTLNRLDAGQKRMAEPVRISKVVETTCLLLTPLAQVAKVRMETDLDTDCIVFAHEGELSRVVSNLMENAIKYNYPEGFVRVSVQRAGAYVEIAVEDSGVGIPEEELPHIFDRFYRVDKARSRDAGGTGLGLSIAWETVRVHGGEIVAERADERGLRMCVRLPAWNEGETSG